MTTEMDRDFARFDELNAAIKALEAERNDIKAKYGTLEDDKYAVAGGVLTVLRKNRFDPALAKGKLTKAQYESILVPKPDSQKAKVLLDSKVYAKCLKKDAPMFTFKAVTDEEEG